MDKELSTSFIPRQSLVKKFEPARQPVSIVALVSILIFLISLAVYGGVFFYDRYLEQTINAPCPSDDPTSTGGCGLVASIDRVQRATDEKLLLEFQRLDAKLREADKLLKDHSDIVKLLDNIGQLTLKSIRYKRFEFKGATITVDGVASSYEDIALQSKVLTSQPTIKSFIFSDLNLDDRGNVTFKLSATIDPAVTNYAATNQS